MNIAATLTLSTYFVFLSPELITWSLSAFNKDIEIILYKRNYENQRRDS
jgi:hypothetical protein